MTNILKEVTSNVFKRILHKEICLPSDFIEIFTEEVLNKKLDIPEAEALFSEELRSEFKKYENYAKKTESLIIESKSIIDSTKDINSKSDIDNLKKDMVLLMETIKELNDQIYKDELTFLLNRKWLYQKYLDNSTKLQENGYIVFIDMNKLKQINDNYGHTIGDKALIYFSNYIKKELLTIYKKENFDLLRFAGDEFIVFIRGTMSEKEIIANFEKIRRNIAGKRFFNKTLKTLKNKNFVISFSFGVKKFQKNDIFEDILSSADSIMYEMKNKAYREK